MIWKRNCIPSFQLLSHFTQTKHINDPVLVFFSAASPVHIHIGTIDFLTWLLIECHVINVHSNQNDNKHKGAGLRRRNWCRRKLSIQQGMLWVRHPIMGPYFITLSLPFINIHFQTSILSLIQLWFLLKYRPKNENTDFEFHRCCKDLSGFFFQTTLP